VVRTTRERERITPNNQTSSLQERALTVHKELRMKWAPQLVQVGYNAGKVRHSNWRKTVSKYRIILRSPPSYKTWVYHMNSYMSVTKPA